MIIGCDIYLKKYAPVLSRRARKLSRLGSGVEAFFYAFLYWIDRIAKQVKFCIDTKNCVSIPACPESFS